MACTWRKLKNIFSRPLFIIIFMAKILILHTCSILTGQTISHILCVKNQNRLFVLEKTIFSLKKENLGFVKRCDEHLPCLSAIFVNNLIRDWVIAATSIGPEKILNFEILLGVQRIFYHIDWFTSIFFSSWVCSLSGGNFHIINLAHDIQEPILKFVILNFQKNYSNQIDIHKKYL